MTTEQIRAALAVSAEGSISKAARRLYLTQPTVSGTLAALERELGFAIFERSNRGVAVTPEGEEFLHRARRIAEELSCIESIAGNKGESCRLHLVTFNSTRVERAFETFCMRHQHARRTDISYRLGSGGLERRAELVYDGSADLALVSTPEAPGRTELAALKRRGLSYQPICSMPVSATMARTHPLSTGELAIARAAEYPRLESSRLSAGSTFYSSAAVSLLRKAPSIQIESRQVRLRLAASGIGYFIGMPLKKDEQEAYGLLSRTIPGQYFQIGVVIDERRMHNAQIQEFIGLVREEYAQDSFAGEAEGGAGTPAR